MVCLPNHFRFRVSLCIFKDLEGCWGSKPFDNLQEDSRHPNRFLQLLPLPSTSLSSFLLPTSDKSQLDGNIAQPIRLLHAKQSE